MPAKSSVKVSAWCVYFPLSFSVSDHMHWCHDVCQLLEMIHISFYFILTALLNLLVEKLASVHCRYRLSYFSHCKPVVLKLDKILNFSLFLFLRLQAPFSSKVTALLFDSCCLPLFTFTLSSSSICLPWLAQPPTPFPPCHLPLIKIFLRAPHFAESTSGQRSQGISKKDDSWITLKHWY